MTRDYKTKHYQWYVHLWSEYYDYYVWKHLLRTDLQALHMI